MLKNKKGAAFSIIIYAIIGLIVLGVSIPIFNLIKNNAGSVNTDELLNMTNEFLNSNTDGFVPGSWIVDASQEYKKALSATTTLSSMLNLVNSNNYQELVLARNIPPAPPNVPTATINAIKDVTGLATTNTEGKYCCQIKLTGAGAIESSVYYSSFTKCEANQVVSSLCNPSCVKEEFNYENGPCFSCTQNSCTIKSFELPQNISGEGFASYRDYVMGNADPKYLLYFESFPKGEEASWEESEFKWFTLGLGAQLGMALLPGAKYFKKLKGVEKVTDVITDINTLSSESKVLNSISHSGASDLKIAEEIALNRKSLISKLDELDNLDEDGLLKMIYSFEHTTDAQRKAAVLGKSLSSSFKNYKKASMNIDEFFGVHFNIDSSSMKNLPTSEKEKILKDFFGDQYDFFKSKGLIVKNDATNDIYLDPRKIRQSKIANEWNDFVVKKADDAGFLAKVDPGVIQKSNAENYLKKLVGDPDAFKTEIERLYGPKGYMTNLYEGNPQKYNELIGKATKDVEEIFGKTGHIDVEDIFKDQASINTIADIFYDNPVILENLKKTGGNLYSGSFKFLGANKGEFTQHMNLLFNEGMLKCTVGALGTGTLITGAIVAGSATSVIGGVGATPFIIPIGQAFVWTAPKCYTLFRTGIFPIMIFSEIIKKVQEDKNRKFVYTTEKSNNMILKGIDTFNPTYSSLDSNNIKKPILLTGPSIPGDGKPFHLVSPCKVNLEIKNAYCKGEFTRNTFFVEKEENGKTNYIPVEPTSVDIAKANSKIYHPWDDFGDGTKIVLLDENLKFTQDLQKKIINAFTLEDVREGMVLKISQNYEDFKYFLEGTTTCEDYFEIYKDIYSYHYGVDVPEIASSWDQIKGLVSRGEIVRAYRIEDVQFTPRSLQKVNPEYYESITQIYPWVKFNSKGIERYQEILDLIRYHKNQCGANKELAYGFLFGNEVGAGDDFFDFNEINRETIRHLAFKKGFITSDWRTAFYEQNPQATSIYDANSRFKYLFNPYKIVSKYNFNTKKEENEIVNFLDYLVRDDFGEYYIIKEGYYASHDKEFKLLSQNTQTLVNSPPTIGLISTQENNKMISYFPCIQINVKDFLNTGSNANYCYQSNNPVYDNVVESMETVSLVGGLIALGVGDPLFMGLDLLAIIGSSYLDSQSQYPKSLNNKAFMGS